MPRSWWASPETLRLRCLFCPSTASRNSGGRGLQHSADLTVSEGCCDGAAMSVTSFYGAVRPRMAMAHNDDAVDAVVVSAAPVLLVAGCSRAVPIRGVQLPFPARRARRE